MSETPPPQQVAVPRSFRQPLALTGVFAVLLVLFLLTPWSGDDWETFHGAAQRVLDRESLYNERITFAYYSNPPWVAVAFTPLALLPEKVGWAAVSAASMLAIMLVLQRWQSESNPLAVVLALLSPPTMYIFLHGQIDALVVALVLLPTEWWILAAATKPQTAVGLIAGIPPARWQRVLLVTGGVFLLTVILFGFWPADLYGRPTPFREGAHNLWRDLWPFQVPVGIGLIAVAWSQPRERLKTERLLIAASPFLAPYAAMSTLIGPWLVALTYLRTWQAALIWLSWWGAVIYRGLA